VDEHDIDDPQASPTPDTCGSYHVDLGLSDGEGAENAKSSRRFPRISRTGLVVAAAIGVALIAGVGIATYTYSVHPVQVPFIVALPPAAAEKRLLEAGLKAGNAHLYATNSFAPGLVIAQAPTGLMSAPRGSSVDVSITVASRALAVADVTNVAQSTAEQALRAQVLTPVILNQFSSAIPIGLVVSQLPRGGDTAFSGSSVYVVVSLGPGTRGSVVPDVIGKPVGEATSTLAAQTLFAYTRTADATGVAAGTVVDQTPAPGSRMQVGANVAIAVTPTR
jgi:eukaryotic-like serine/threonine-protein kinase